MINFKALFVGASTIIFFGLLLQLIFLLAATGYTIVIREHPEWQTIGQLLSYTIGGISYFVIMSASGYITANIAQKNVYLHAFLIALLTTGISLISSVREDGFTLNSILFVVSGIAFTIIGGYIWLSHQHEERIIKN
ncbi:MAG: hypothetical protein OQL06_09515 [Gammaproteobacteria bacterium]|nr:hypothetical protein [Gammaproteobacteria bacterium]